MNTIYILSIVIMSIAVICGAGLRLYELRSETHKFGWGAMYIAALGFASSCLIGLTECKDFNHVSFLGLAAWCFNLYNTHSLWPNGAPPSTLKGA